MRVSPCTTHLRRSCLVIMKRWITMHRLPVSFQALTVQHTMIESRVGRPPSPACNASYPVLNMCFLVPVRKVRFTGISGSTPRLPCIAYATRLCTNASLWEERSHYESCIGCSSADSSATVSSTSLMLVSNSTLLEWNRRFRLAGILYRWPTLLHHQRQRPVDFPPPHRHDYLAWQQVRRWREGDLAAKQDTHCG